MKEFKVKAFSKGSTSDAVIYFEESSNEVKLTFKINDRAIVENDMYPFFALLKIRAALEQDGIFLLCNGARRDVYPSGASAVGTMAYELEIGKQGIHLVSIFEAVTDIEKIGTVEEQRKYREEWVKSLR